jgi:hypothetical protein
VQPKSDTLAAHLHSCEACSLIVRGLEADQVLWEDLFTRSADAAVGQALGSRGRQEIMELIHPADSRTTLPARLTRIKENMIDWISPLWQPMYAGEAVTAADMAEQSNHFDMDYGEYIDLSCHWQEEKNESVAITVAWQANLLQPSRLWVRFLDPDRGEVLAEIELGSELTGRMRISGEQLSFDPLRDKWAIAVITENK